MLKETYSPEETYEFGYFLGQKANSGDVFCLVGDLGVGKTIFTKGLAKGLEIEEHITSPTFTIINEYHSGRLPFYHLDVYRIADIEEMEEIGYEELFYGDGVCLIEWANLIKPIIPKESTWITIEKNLEKSLDFRIIKVQTKIKD